MVLDGVCWLKELKVCLRWDFWKELLMRGGKVGLMLGWELYVENVERDLGIKGEVKEFFRNNEKIDKWSDIKYEIE